LQFKIQSAEKIKKVVEVLKVSNDEAECMLITYKFDLEKLLGDYLNDTNSSRQKCGLKHEFDQN
jgi:hypothetical protein